MARVVEVIGGRVVIAVSELDWSNFNGEMVIALSEQEAEDLMHALEAWKDER